VNGLADLNARPEEPGEEQTRSPEQQGHYDRKAGLFPTRVSSTKTLKVSSEKRKNRPRAPDT
jgi:hypothetical protein